MTSSTLSKLACAIICNMCRSLNGPPLGPPTPDIPLPPPPPADMGWRMEAASSEVNEDHEGKLEVEAFVEVGRADWKESSKRGESSGDTIARKNDIPPR